MKQPAADPPKSKIFGLRVPWPMWEALRDEAKALDRPASWVVMKLITEHQKQRERQTP